jgi:hypothetical protein
MILELYREQIKKLNPNMGYYELNKMVANYEIEARKQEGRFRENELNGTYRFRENETKYN